MMKDNVKNRVSPLAHHQFTWLVIGRGPAGSQHLLTDRSATAGKGGGSVKGIVQQD
jgi:hypothetical protein